MEICQGGDSPVIILWYKFIIFISPEGVASQTLESSYPLDIIESEDSGRAVDTHMDGHTDTHTQTDKLSVHAHWGYR